MDEATVALIENRDGIAIFMLDVNKQFLVTGPEQPIERRPATRTFRRIPELPHGF